MRENAPREPSEAVRELDRARVRAQARARLFGGSPEPVRIARFELRKRLGSGATGVVYAALDPQLEREVAVKVLAFHVDEELSLLKEARTLARLSHPHVLPVFEAGVHEGLPYLVSELVDGGTLRQWLATPRSDEELLRVLVEIGRGVSAGHARALVHRDLKPENVLIGGDGRARVADFGLAALHSDDRREASNGGGGPLPGTMQYMAPEQLSGERADPLSDQFSYCVVGWEMLTGTPPFQGATSAELLEAIHEQRLLESSTSPLRERALRVLRRGLTAVPTARFPTMDSLLAELGGAPRHAPPPIVWVAGTLAIITLGGAAAWALSPSWRSPAPSQPSSGPPPPAASASITEATDELVRDRELGSQAQRMAQAGRWGECADYLSDKAKSEGMLLMWISCARLAPDVGRLERACDAWSKAKHPGPHPPMIDECAPALLRAKKLASAGDYRACAETLLAAPPTQMAMIQLSECTAKVRDVDLYKRQCHFQYRLNGASPAEHTNCEEMK